MARTPPGHRASPPGQGLPPGPGDRPGEHPRRALIVGLDGPVLHPAEHTFLSQHRPAGIIMFTRNCVGHDQIRTLVGAAKAAIGGRALVLIDQEGGRVQRLRPPLGRALPAAAAYGRLYAREPTAALTAAGQTARLLAHDMVALGINTVCAPVLDVPVAGAHDIIGDRAFGHDPGTVAALGRAVAEGLLAGGVLPVIKHIPGHGRAGADSHLELPVVTGSRAALEEADFAAFRLLRDMPAAMTAHVVFTAIDADHPASTSAKVTREVIRGAIGFNGLLMSDDLAMKALHGSIAARARAVIAAGCDVALHCNGVLAEMQAAAEAVPMLAGRALKRFQACLACLEGAKPFDRPAAEVLLAAILETRSWRRAQGRGLV